MPYALPRGSAQRNAYNEQLQKAYGETRRVPQAVPAGDSIAELKELAQLHSSGALTDAEFAAAKAKLLGTGTT